MRVFVTKAFRRFQRKEGIDDALLGDAIACAERGLIDADLGGGLIKQRIARQGQGKRGGFRTIVAYRMHDRSVFLFGFAKNARENISEADRRDLQDYGAMLLAFDERTIETMIVSDELREVPYYEEGE